MKRVLSTALVLFIALSCFCQEAWELTNISEKDWNVYGQLNIQKNHNSISLKNPTHFTYRDNAMNLSEAEEYAILSNNYPSIGLDTHGLGRTFELSFEVENRTIPEDGPRLPLFPDLRCTRLYFWTIDLIYTTFSNRQETKKIYIIRTSGNPYYEYGYNFTSREFTLPYDGGILPVRRIHISFNSPNCEVNLSGSCVARIDDIKCINNIRISIAGQTGITISNTTCKLMTKYGQALPYIQRATDYLNRDAALAAQEMIVAINNGLDCYETYLIRGIAYYMQGYYKSAIEDLTSAISCSSDNKEKAYFYRGMSKLALDDDNGISDLRNGGQEGIVFLRENNLMNCTTGQKKKNTTVTPKQKSHTQKKKPILKK